MLINWIFEWYKKLQKNKTTATKQDQLITVNNRDFQAASWRVKINRRKSKKSTLDTSVVFSTVENFLFESSKSKFLGISKSFGLLLILLSISVAILYLL